MKKMYSVIRECLTEYLEHLETYAKDGKDVDMKDMSGRFTMDVIATCAFATKTNSHKDPNNPFIINAKNIFNLKASKVIPALIFPSFLLKILNIKSVNDVNSSNFFLDLMRHILKTRRNNKVKYNDFIQLLMDAEKNEECIHDENDTNEAHHVNDGIQ